MDVKNWAENIGYTDDDKSELIRLLLYGKPGVGKTKFIGTFPNPFVIDTDKGLVTLNKYHIPNIALVRGDSTFRIIMDILRKLEHKEAPFDTLKVETLGLDSVTALMDFLHIDLFMHPTGVVKGRNSQAGTARNPNNMAPEQGDYMILANRMRTIMKKCQDLGLNVVATCGERVDEDQVTHLQVGRPNILGGYRELIGHDFDEMYYMATKGTGEKTKYLAYTRPYNIYPAKSRTGRPPIMEDPHYDKLIG